MQIEAIYHNGRLEFTCPVHLREGPLRLLVEVPSDAIVPPAGIAEPAGAGVKRSSTSVAQSQAATPPALPRDVAARLDQRRTERAQILARPPTLAADSAPTEEQDSRLSAAAERRAWRAEQGRS